MHPLLGRQLGQPSLARARGGVRVVGFPRAGRWACLTLARLDRASSGAVYVTYSARGGVGATTGECAMNKWVKYGLGAVVGLYVLGKLVGGGDDKPAATTPDTAAPAADAPAEVAKDAAPAAESGKQRCPRCVRPALDGQDVGMDGQRHGRLGANPGQREPVH